MYSIAHAVEVSGNQLRASHSQHAQRLVFMPIRPAISHKRSAEGPVLIPGFFNCDEIIKLLSYYDRLMEIRGEPKVSDQF